MAVSLTADSEGTGVDRSKRCATVVLTLRVRRAPLVLGECEMFCELDIP